MTGEIAMYQLTQAASKSNYQKTWEGTPPCKEGYFYTMWGWFPSPDVIQQYGIQTAYVNMPLNSQIVRVKEAAMNAFQCQNSSVYGEGLEAQMLFVGQVNAVGQWNKPPATSERFIYMQGPKVMQPKDIVPPRVAV